MYPESFQSEINIRVSKIAQLLCKENIDAILISDNANLFYTSGRVFSGYTYITSEGKIYYFVKKPIGLKGDNVIYIRKPEQIAEELNKLDIAIPDVIALELDTTSYTDAMRLENALGAKEYVNGSPIMRIARSIKTPYEISRLKDSGVHHDRAYHQIEKKYREGMTEIELQIEIEKLLRMEGSLGQFRVSGQSMEIFMGNVLCGDNADTPTPYDFAMGGAGLSPSLPVGANGTTIRPGMTVMVDMGGNFNGYMTDMTRVFRVGDISPLAIKAHNLSIAIHGELIKMARPGIEAKSLYEKAIEMVKEAKLEEYFMGHAQKAGFIGHGIGIEINEMPVLAPRSKDILEEGNVIAIEPKFVIPHVGAVGIENSYVVTQSGLEKITNYPEQISELF